MRHGKLSSAKKSGNDSSDLRRLGDEARRLADALSRLSDKGSQRADPSAIVEVKNRADSPLPGDSALADNVRGLIRARRLRSQFFPEELFADPAWDILLDLMHAKLSQARVSVSSLCLASCVPPTTALRWIKTLEGAGLIEREADLFDARRYFISLSPAALDSMHNYFRVAEALTAP